MSRDESEKNVKVLQKRNNQSLNSSKRKPMEVSHKNTATFESFDNCNKTNKASDLILSSVAQSIFCHRALQSIVMEHPIVCSTYFFVILKKHFVPFLFSLISWPFTMADTANYLHCQPYFDGVVH
jgi:hypothetical protein